MPTWMAALVAVAAIAAMWLFCVRPHLKGSGSCAMGANSIQDAEVDRQIAQLREELRILRAQDAVEASRTNGRPNTTHKG